MKRFIAAILILATVFTVSLVLENTVEKALKKSSELFYECAEKSDLTMLKKTVSYWNRKKEIFFSISNRTQFSEVENNITEIESYIKNYDLMSTDILCMETAAMLEKLAQEYKVRVENIF